MLERILETEAMDSIAETESYDSMDHTAANNSFVGRLFDLGASGRMLDIGTGPGHMPPLICDRDPDATVVGVDLAQHMIAAAENNLAKTTHGARIEYVHMDAKGLNFADGEFDTVFSNTILQPGGTLLVRDLFRPPSREQLEALVAAHAGECTEHQRGLFADSLHAAFSPEEFRDLADESGLKLAEIVIDSDRHMSLQARAAR